MYRIRISFLSILILFSLTAEAKTNKLVESSWQICKQDSDCTMVFKDSCRPCCNEQALNKSFLPSYKEKLKKECPGKYPGMCKCAQMNKLAKCVKNRCEVYFNHVCCGKNAPKRCETMRVNCKPRPLSEFK